MRHGLMDSAMNSLEDTSATSYRIPCSFNKHLVFSKVCTYSKGKAHMLSLPSEAQDRHYLLSLPGAI